MPAGPEQPQRSRPNQRGGPAHWCTRAPRFKPDGRSPGVSKREGRWRGEAGRRGPPVIPNPESRRPASSPAMMQGTARSGVGTAGLSVVSPFGWRWSWPPEQPRSPATRSRGGGASGVGGSGRSRLQKEWGKRGEGSVVPRGSRSRENGGGEACSARTPTSRGGVARARSRAWAALEMNGGAGG